MRSEKDGKDKGDVGTLLAFAKEAGEVLAEKAKKLTRAVLLW